MSLLLFDGLGLLDLDLGLLYLSQGDLGSRRSRRDGDGLSVSPVFRLLPGPGPHDQEARSKLLSVGMRVYLPPAFLLARNGDGVRSWTTRNLGLRHVCHCTRVRVAPPPPLSQNC